MQRRLARPIARALVAAVALLLARGAWAYPEFQQWVAAHAPRSVDCALCHRHPDGPEGLKPGQIGSLDPQEIEQLQKARAAFDPGQHTTNPLLNEFGNSIIDRIGKREFLTLRQDPSRLPALYGQDSDLDGDGVSDADEFLAGTHPVNPQSGPPWRLFTHNLRVYRLHILLLALATAAGLFGLNNLLRACALWLSPGNEDNNSGLVAPRH